MSDGGEQMSTDKNERAETLADIVEMLRANARGERFDDFSFTSLADRIEAAAERDIKAAKDGVWHTADDIHDIHCRDCVARQSGNAAVMREALVRCATLGEYCFQDIHAEVAKVARAALSAPARNCDRFKNDDYAFVAWLDSLKGGDVGSVRNAFKWLFAKAEGGAE